MSDPTLNYLHARSPTSPGHQPTWPRPQRTGVKYTKHSDSGVADVDSEDGEISLRPMAAQRVPYGPVSEYDYAARGSHLYEDLPIKYAPAPEEYMKPVPEAHQQSSWPSTVSTTPSTTNSQANIVNNNTEARKRHNPLYDAIQKQHPGPPVSSTKQEAGHKLSSQRLMCVCVFAVIALVISLISLCLAIFILATLPTDKYDRENQAHLDRYNQLKADYKDLSNKYSELAKMLSYNPDDEANSTETSLGTRVARNRLSIQDLQENVTLQQGAVDGLITKVVVIGDIEKKLVVHSGNISQNSDHIKTTSADVSSLTTELTRLEELVRNVSKMEGPRGPQGVGNLSACFYSNTTQTLPNASPHPTHTGWNPSVTLLQDNVVLAASCSVVGGTVSSLESRPQESALNAMQYRCGCSGTVSGVRDRHCYLHLWMCPRLS